MPLPSMTAYAALVPIWISRTRYCSAQARGGVIGIVVSVHVIPPFVLLKILGSTSTVGNPGGGGGETTGCEVPARRTFPLALTAIDSNRRHSLFASHATGGLLKFGEISRQLVPF